MTTRRLATGLLALAAAASVTACGAGRDAMTYQERNSAGATDVAVGDLALRNVSVLPPPEGDVYEPGTDARVVLTVANDAEEGDRLLEVTSPVAREVVVLDESGEETDLQVAPFASTQGRYFLELRGLTSQVRTGEYVPLTFRFARSGSTEVLVPVELTGETDRPVYTGERFEGGEEPALQGPAGGDHGSADDEDH